jgi:hypothetical protein
MQTAKHLSGAAVELEQQSPSGLNDSARRLTSATSNLTTLV